MLLQALQPGQAQTLLKALQSITKAAKPNPKKSRKPPLNASKAKPATPDSAGHPSAPISNGKGKGTSGPMQSALPDRNRDIAQSKQTVTHAKQQTFIHPWQLRAVDWTGNAAVCNMDQFLEEVEKHGANDDWSAVVCISSTIEAEELHAILLGYPGLKLTIARPALQDDPLVSEIESGEKGNLWSVRMVPVRTQGSISSRRVIIQQCSGNAPTLKRAAVKATTVTAPAPTVVIRLSTEKRYVTSDAFKVVLGKPGQMARVWLHHLGGRELTDKVSDSWGFRTENSGESITVCGMMRIEQHILQQVLSFSGKQGGGQRWFVDPLPRNSEHGVRWSKRNADEDWINYANRLHSDAPPLGVVRGVSSLGIRCPKSDLTAESKVRTWRVLSVPKNCLEAQVKQVLTEVGLESVQPLNRRLNGRHTCAWTVS